MPNHGIEHFIFCGNPTYTTKARFVSGTQCMLPKFDILTYDTKKNKVIGVHIWWLWHVQTYNSHFDTTWETTTLYMILQYMTYTTSTSTTLYNLSFNDLRLNHNPLPNDNDNDIIKLPHLETWTLKLLVRHILDSFDESWELMMIDVGGPSTKINGFFFKKNLIHMGDPSCIGYDVEAVDGVYHDQCKMHVVMHRRDISHRLIRYHLSWVYCLTLSDTIYDNCISQKWNTNQS